MSSKENADRLAQALSGLGYVEPITTEGGDFGTIKVLCRVKTDRLVEWANVVESILKRAVALDGDDSQWDSHICRLYMLKNGALVYGWMIAITARYMDSALSHIIPTIKTHVLAPPGIVMPPDLAPAAPTAKEAPILRAVPESDSKGNPIVPPTHRVDTIPMAGLDPQLDRNAPSEETKGKGGYGMFDSARLGSPFKPPR